jgi:2-dehydropantoate 2-reductase
MLAGKGLNLPNDIVMQTIHKLEKHQRATSSMHRDVWRKFELASLTEFVVNEG